MYLYLLCVQLSSFFPNRCQFYCGKGFHPPPTLIQGSPLHLGGSPVGAGLALHRSLLWMVQLETPVCRCVAFLQTNHSVTESWWMVGTFGRDCKDLGNACSS